jgi:hypothetical protein
MGTVIGFPEQGRATRDGRLIAGGSATVIILPVIRIERYSDESSEETRSQRRRRRRREQRGKAND